jgi:hypothetical protein
MMTRFKRIAAALTAALALHVLLLAWLEPGKQRSEKGQPLQVRLLRSEPGKSLQNPAAERADAAANKHPEGVPARRKTARRERPHLSAPVLPGRGGPDRIGPANGTAGLSLVLERPLPLADPGTEVGGGGPAQQKARAEDIAEQKATVERRIAGWVIDAKAAQRLEVPDVHWREAAAALEEGFRPRSEMFGRAPADIPAPADRNSLQARAAALHAPLNGDLSVLPNEARGLESVSLAGGPRSSISLGSIVGLITARTRRRLTAVVRIAHGEDGSISAVTLVAGSGDADYDRLALAQTRLLDRLPDRERRACRSVWVFESELTTIPTTTVRSHVHLAALD